MKIKLLDLLSKLLPFTRGYYLRAFYSEWDARTSIPAPAVADFLEDGDDVYNGHQFEWSPRALPKRVADALLQAHDAQVEREKNWEFSELLQSNL